MGGHLGSLMGEVKQEHVVVEERGKWKHAVVKGGVKQVIAKVDEGKGCKTGVMEAGASRGNVRHRAQQQQQQQ